MSHLIQINIGQQIADGLGTQPGVEKVPELLAQSLPADRFHFPQPPTLHLGQRLFRYQLEQHIHSLLELLNTLGSQLLFFLNSLPQFLLVHLPGQRFVSKAYTQEVRFSLVFKLLNFFTICSFLQVFVMLLESGNDFIAGFANILFLFFDGLLNQLAACLDGFTVHLNGDVGGEISYLLQHRLRDIEQEANRAGHAL